jgi:hypothetical protein
MMPRRKLPPEAAGLSVLLMGAGKWASGDSRSGLAGA